MVYWTALDLTADAWKHYGTHNIIRVLNVIRCVVLKSLWTERNTAIFRPHLLQSRTDTISTALSTSKSAAYNIDSHLIRISKGLELLRRATIAFKGSVYSTSTIHNQCRHRLHHPSTLYHRYRTLGPRVLRTAKNTSLRFPWPLLVGYVSDNIFPRVAKVP